MPRAMNGLHEPFVAIHREEVSDSKSAHAHRPAAVEAQATLGSPAHGQLARRQCA